MSHHVYPDTTSRDSDWRHLAACRLEDPELFFPKGSGGTWELVIEEAKAVCHRCPVRQDCLQWALKTSQESGVWGGLAEAERRSMKRRASRAKAVKPPAVSAVREAPLAVPQRTLQSVLAERTVALRTGHLAWTGVPVIRHLGRQYTGKQVAFIVDRGRDPKGNVRTECGVGGCVLAEHIMDAVEREALARRNAAAKKAGVR